MGKVEIRGTVTKEVPDPAHANETPNWFKVPATFPHVFTGETKDAAFRKIQRWQAQAYYGTTNGMVPHFEFADPAEKAEYYTWDKTRRAEAGKDEIKRKEESK